jgi:hypothetical protein
VVNGFVTRINFVSNLLFSIQLLRIENSTPLLVNHIHQEKKPLAPASLFETIEILKKELKMVCDSR